LWFENERELLLLWCKCCGRSRTSCFSPSHVLSPGETCVRLCIEESKPYVWRMKPRRRQKQSTTTPRSHAHKHTHTERERDRERERERGKERTREKRKVCIDVYSALARGRRRTVDGGWTWISLRTAVNACSPVCIPVPFLSSPWRQKKRSTADM